MVTIVDNGFIGLSTDTKPTKELTCGYSYLELDTGKIWIYSAANINPLTGNGWWEV